MINTELDIKSKFVEMCRFIFVNSEGKFVFPIENLIYDSDYSEFLNHDDWTILESKMSNLIIKMNSDPSILEKDVESEIWDMI